MPAQLEISTELDNLAFVPGDRVRGRVSWTSDEPEPPESVDLRLFYYTAGKGTRDVEIVDRHRFERPGLSGEQEFSFQLPEGPYSFSGKLVSLIWALELQLDDGPSERLEITLSPTGEEIDLYAHDDGDLPEYSNFVIGKKKKQQKQRSLP